MAFNFRRLLGKVTPAPTTISTSPVAAMGVGRVSTGKIVGTHLAHTGIQVGLGELVGYGIGRKFEWLHEPGKEWRSAIVPVVAGLFKVGGIVADCRNGGRPTYLGAVTNAVGDAGLGAVAVLDGLARGFHRDGKQQLAFGGRPISRIFGQPQTVVGAIPQTPAGQWLDGAGLRHFGTQAQR